MAAKRGVIWRAFAGLSGIIEAARNAFAKQAQIRDLHIYLLTLHGPRHLIPRIPATYLRA